MIHLDEHLRRALAGPYSEERKALFSIEMYDRVKEWGTEHPAQKGSESTVTIGSWSVTVLEECDPRDASLVLEKLRVIQASQPMLLGLTFTLGASEDSPTAVAAAGKFGDIYFFNHRESGRLFATALQEVSETTMEHLIFHELAHVADNLKTDESVIANIVLAKPEEVKQQLLKLNESYFTEINRLFLKINSSKTAKENMETANYIAGEAVAEIFACLHTGDVIPDYPDFLNVTTQLRGDWRRDVSPMKKPVAYVDGMPIYRGGM